MTTITMRNRELIDVFLDSALAYPERPALWCEGTFISYDGLAGYAAMIASVIRSSAPLGGALQCAVLGQRRHATYASILGALLVGYTYVPLNVLFPIERNLRILASSQARILLCDSTTAKLATEIAARSPTPITIIPVDLCQMPGERNTLNSLSKLRDSGARSPYAYLLFTSGSTGVPKGVAVTHENVLQYLQSIQQRYAFSPLDRFTQLFEFSFDLSVHDLFVSWDAGACLYAVPPEHAMLPAKFVKEHALTVWFSVPSTAALMKRARTLKPGALSSLQVTLFCGEALSASLANDWRHAAPNSLIDNLYGPTEATIAFTAYRLSAHQEYDYTLSSIPIGHPLPGQRILLVDEALHPIAPESGEIGQLLLGGSQVTAGYWNEPSLTEKSFVHLPMEGQNMCWYCTGDLAVWDPRHGYVFRGRLDQQVKIRGYRVELLEIEQMLCRAADTELVAVIPFGDGGDGTFSDLVAYMSQPKTECSAILRICREMLPDYMIPSEIIVLSELPLNANGKVDRSVLRAKHSR